jgi:beta-glucosidase
MTISCRITNTGTIDAYEVPQLYTRQRSGDLARPICELRGFQKIFIPAGETRTVSFTLTKEQLGYWHEKKNGLESRVWFATDDADFQIWIAPNCGQRVN